MNSENQIENDQNVSTANIGWWRAIRDSLAGKQHDFTSLPIPRAILLLAVPMVLEMAMESVFAVVDVFFVSKLGPEAIATVGLTESVLTLLYAVAIGLAMATTATVARRIGEKNVDGAVNAASQAIGLGVIVSLLIAIPGILFSAEILRLMEASEETIAVGSGYTSILLGTNVVIMLIFLNNAIYRGAGDAALAMRSLWLANGINIVLDPCLIFGLGPFPEMGVAGAAVATTCGRGVGVLYQLWGLRRGAGRLRLAGPEFRFQWAPMLNLLRISLGGIGQFLVATASWVALMRIVSTFGDMAVAGYTVAVRIVIFAILPAWGLSNAAATLVGQNLGAKSPDRAERSVWLTGIYNMAFLGFVTLVFVIFADELVYALCKDEEITRRGASALRIMSYGYIFYAWGMVMMQAFNGAGDTGTPTKINLVVFWMFQIPFAWYLAKQLDVGPQGVFWAVTVAESLLAVVSILIFRRGKWKAVQV